MRLRLLVPVLGFGLVVSCGAPQKPVTFVTAARAETAVDTISRALATRGLPAAKVDRQANVVQTKWKDTGFLFGQVQGVNATIVRRYVVTLGPSAEGTSVVVSVDTKRCAQGGYNIADMEVRGACEELPTIPAGMQNDLEALAATIRAALGSPSPTTASPASGSAGGPAQAPTQ
jgi:hypothetical protein